MLEQVTVRLLLAKERRRWDQLMMERHYLKSADMVGCQLRYVAELDGEWVGLLGWCAAAYQHRPYTAKHFRSLREHYLGLSDPRIAKGRRHQLAPCCRSVPSRPFAERVALGR